MWLSLLKFNWGKWLPYIAGAVLIAYIAYVEVQLEDARADKKYAEDNVVLINNEYDRIADSYDLLEITYDVREEYHSKTIQELTKAHEKTVDRAVHIAITREGIRNASSKDDGNISRVLSDALDSLRMYE